MKEQKKIIFSTIYSLLIVLSAFGINLLIQYIFNTQMLIPMIFVLGIFLISLRTDGYIYGIISSLISVLLVNFAFTFPYYGFDLLSPIPLFSALIMMTVAILTCAATKKQKEMEKIKADTAREQMRANLLRAVSHDLRTPLTTIYGSCSAIIESYDEISKEQILKHLTEIRQESEWLIRMVENLLSVTRIDGEKVHISKSEIVLEELIDSVLLTFAKRYPETPVTVSIPDKFISIPMDAILIEQVLINLLENSVIHAKGMTALNLTVELNNGYAVFEVIDNGCGIAAEKLDKLFSGCIDEYGVTSDSSRNNMGIGLAVCSTIIKAHGSTITAENMATGGACFRSKQRNNFMSNNKYKILIIDDEHNIVSFITTVLETNGYQVFTAMNCGSGQMMFTSYCPDLVILDLGLPDKDGLEFITYVRATSNTPIIVLSARTGEYDKVQALDLGANDYITKPFGTAELLARIRASLRTTKRSENATCGKFILRDMIIDYDTRVISINAKEIKLTQTEYNIVATLSEYSGKVMTYTSLIRAVWGSSDPGSIKKLQVNMANIRKKLGIKPGENQYIINELNVGYRMPAE